MALPLGLISKSLVGVVSVGAVGGGSWVLWDKGSWTQLDEEIFEGSGSWEGTSTPASDGSLSAGSEPKIEITGTLTTSGTNTSKKGICTIKGNAPQGVTSGTYKISEQLTTLKNAIGANESGQPDNTGDKGDKAKKFFTYCIKNRTGEEGWKAKGGVEVNSTIHMEIKKYGENTSPEYKFDEEEFKKLYS